MGKGGYLYLGAKELDQWIKCLLVKHEKIQVPKTHIRARCSISQCVHLSVSSEWETGGYPEPAGKPV